jgi:hypothetical protein
MREEAEGRPPLLPISGSCSCSSDFTCTIKGRMLMTTSSSMQIKTGVNIFVECSGNTCTYKKSTIFAVLLMWIRSDRHHSAGYGSDLFDINRCRYLLKF